MYIVNNVTGETFTVISHNGDTYIINYYNVKLCIVVDSTVWSVVNEE